MPLSESQTFRAHIQQQAALLLLGALILNAILTILLQIAKITVQPIDFVLQAVAGLIWLVLFGQLWRSPTDLANFRVPFILAAVVAVVLPTWIVTFEATMVPQVTLVEALPSAPTLLFRLALAMPILLPPARLVWFASGLWGAVAIPVLGYLVLHPDELQTPRGIDFVLTLGPGIGIALALVVFYTRLQVAVERLQADRQHWQQRAEQDALTGLYNRGTGEQRLQAMWQQAERPLVAIVFDLDHFKTVNDTLGHPAGDRVLREVARRCSQHLQADDLFARWGGEEFLVARLDASAIDGDQLAEELRQIIAERPFPGVGRVTASLGVAARSSRDESWVAALERADRALYDAKTAGRNCVFRLDR